MEKEVKPNINKIGRKIDARNLIHECARARARARACVCVCVCVCVIK